MYGRELILDLHQCDVAKFNRESLTEFLGDLCTLIDMQGEELHFWDDVGVPEDQCQTDLKTKGTSAVLFILTSTIVIHTLDLTGTVFINVFSCDEFDVDQTRCFCHEFFGAMKHRHTVVERTSS